MHQHGQCPACGNELSTEKLCGQMIVCDCGWTHSYNASLLEKKSKDKVILSMVLMCSLFIASFIHAVNWDSHFFTIIPLKLKHYTGTASVSDLKEIVEICSHRSKHDCVETAYQKIYEVDSTQIEILAELGHLQYLRSNIKGSAHTLKTYFDNGGKSMDAAFDYARSLAHLGEYQESIAYFKKVIRSKPKTFQVTVARAYIQTLIKSDRLTQAKSVIEYYRKRSVSSAFFMDKEYKELRSKLGPNRRIAKSG